MKRVSWLCSLAVTLFSFLILGCISVSKSPTPRFYMLPLADSAQIGNKFDIPAGFIIAIGPIGIPEYQNRPQIVTKSKEGMLNFAQFDRWGEALDFGLSRLIVENLTIMLPDANFQIFPCNFAIPLDYQVMVDVVQLESELDKDMFMVAQWTVIDSKSREMLLTKRSEFRQAISPHNYSGLAQALSGTITKLSFEIADSLARLANQPKAKSSLVSG